MRTTLFLNDIISNIYDDIISNLFTYISKI